MSLDKLPELWVINRKGLKDVIEWCNKNRQNTSTMNYSEMGNGWYFHYPIKHKSYAHVHDYIEKGYTEITYEQFKMWVLNQHYTEEYPVW